MLSMTISEIAAACNAQIAPNHTALSTVGAVSVCGISTDTRSLQPGNLFVALQGERFDGHMHLHTARAKGAVGCVVAQSSQMQHIDIPSLVVKQTLAALGAIAHAWRNRFDLPILALTGSNGKTTVKEMLRSIALCAHQQNDQLVLCTEGNFNNEIGVPQMLAQLNAQHRVAILEAGMNQFGEIFRLTEIIAPNIALINNAGPAHLEGLGSIAGVAKAKGEMIEALSPQGVVVLNRDDAYFDYWKQLAGARKVISFGQHPEADVRGEWLTSGRGDDFSLSINNQLHKVAIALHGAHNRMNALAAAAGAHALGYAPTHIAQGLAAFQGITGRLEMLQGLHGSVIIDDSYNANPASMAAAVSALANTSGKKILALGAMGELGEQSATLHGELGELIAKSLIDKVYATGELMRNTVNTCGAKAQWFATKQELIAALLPELASNVRVLVKGSRSSAMEEVVKALLDSEKIKTKESLACC